MKRNIQCYILVFVAMRTCSRRNKCRTSSRRNQCRTSSRTRCRGSCRNNQCRTRGRRRSNQCARSTWRLNMYVYVYMQVHIQLIFGFVFTDDLQQISISNDGQPPSSLYGIVDAGELDRLRLLNSVLASSSTNGTLIAVSNGLSTHQSDGDKCFLMQDVFGYLEILIWVIQIITTLFF